MQPVDAKWQLQQEQGLVGLSSGSAVNYSKVKGFLFKDERKSL